MKNQEKLILKTNCKHNLILSSDAYKFTHWKLYPENTQKVYSYLEARGSEYKVMPATLFYGLQIYLKKYLEGIVVEQWMINEAELFCEKMFGQKYFNRDEWQRIVDVHGGKLPVRIKAVPEGTLVPIHNVLMTIENTDEHLPWITNFLETLLFEATWYGTTVASMSFWIKCLIDEYARETGESVGPFHLNDFGYRGVSSYESAGIGGSAHIINFLGTDNFAGIEFAMKYYGADVCAYSVMASEHSVVEMYTKEGELDAYKRFLDVVPDGAIISSVSDTYDYKNCVENMICKELKDKILGRNGKFVVRPDSGYPPDIAVWTLKTLKKYFGSTQNEAGYTVLNPHIGVIYGDGIEYEMIDNILDAITDAGFAASNIIFGMGGALLQRLNRDTFKMAIKASWGKVDGVEKDVWKETKTDTSKASKRGRLRLINGNSGWQTYTEQVKDRHGIEILQEADQLVTVFENGEIIREYTFDEVRANAQKSFEEVTKG
jgi:nicotinamide phosphoribosyltransferase